jgi:hypothetical protein
LLEIEQKVFGFLALGAKLSYLLAHTKALLLAKTFVQ